MKRTKAETNKKGERGVGNLVKLSENKVRMDFEGSDDPVVIEISETTVPEILLKVLASKTVDAKIPVELTLDESGTKILFVKPLVGTFDFKLLGFYAPKDQKPKIETRPGAGGKDYDSFSAIVEVQNKTGAKKDLWRGVRFNILLFPDFGKDEDGNLTVLSKGTTTDFLSDFLDVIGLGNKNIPASENPLPEIERLALLEGRIFSAVVGKTVNKKGIAYANVVMFNTYIEEDDDFPLPDIEGKEEVHPALQDGE